MHKICVVTATRAEYGLLKNVIKEIEKDEDLDLYLIATGTHLSNDYGYTVQEIYDDGLIISDEIQILDDGNDELGIINTMANATRLLGEVLNRERPDLLVVLGDRYELLPICQCAVVLGIPIAHISGGEITEGAIDDFIRHAITKLSHLHFPGCEQYRQRIIQMGEEPNRVFNYGDVGIENIINMEYMSRQELEKSLNIKLDKPFACVTFHPVTLENACVEQQIMQVLDALKEVKDMIFIITKANADAGGKIINSCIDEFVEKNINSVAFYSVGIKRYLSLMKLSEFVLGNSSSGIVEAPSLKIPTINVGNRQKGRLQASSIINCEPKTNEILDAINMARTDAFKEIARNTVNPYGNGNTATLIVQEIKKYVSKDDLDNRKKSFYDMAIERM